MPKCSTTGLCGLVTAAATPSTYARQQPGLTRTNNVIQPVFKNFIHQDPKDEPRPRKSKDDSAEVRLNGIMGTSHSQAVNADDSPNGTKGRRRTQVERNDSGDEDPTACAVDRIGRQTASNADLINVQRSEKTDVTAGLEDRWLRSHFSGANAAATGAQSTSEAAENVVASQASAAADKRRSSEWIEESSKLDKRSSALFEGVKDIKVKQSRDCVTVSSENEILPGHAPPENTRKRFTILHFNDVYELTERRKEPVGGAARFASLFNDIGEAARKDCGGDAPFIVFGGDCLNPSILSSATKGRHMINVLNQLKVNAAVFGNHEFDFGVDHAAACIANMESDWFLSNVTDTLEEGPLANGVVSKIMEWNGIKIGVIGLIEEEWLDTLATVDKCELEFEDYVTRGNDLSQDLKVKGADLVIALTHMRWPNDIRLAQEVEGIDIILGGHDHEYGVKLVNDCLIVKSGCDFQTFSRVDIYLKTDRGIDVSVTKYDVTSDIQPEPEMEGIVNKYMTVLEEQLQKSIGVTKIPLNGLYKDVRSRETNLGNFVADIMRMTTRAEIVLINSGTFRSNAIHSEGNFSVRDLMSILPIHDNVVVIEVTGHQLIAGLENAVSKYPRHEGRFPQISGFSFGFDPKQPPMARVVHDSVIVKGKPLDKNRVYKLATKAYVARGKDGYGCFSDCKLLNDPDSGPVLSTVIRNHISNVWGLLNHEEKTGAKIKVTEDGKKITSNCGKLHNIHSYCFIEEDAPVYKLQKSMEEIVPKDVDINGNKPRRHSERNGGTSECIGRKDYPDSRDGWMLHMQHLIEISRDDIFDKSVKVTDQIAMHRRKAIEADKKNYPLLSERQKNYEDVRWQVLPLVEGRIFSCPKQ